MCRWKESRQSFEFRAHSPAAVVEVFAHQSRPASAMHVRHPINQITCPRPDFTQPYPFQKTPRSTAHVHHYTPPTFRILILFIANKYSPARHPC